MTRTAARVSSVALVGASFLAFAVPAYAADPSVEGQDPTTMSVGEAVLIFAGIPLTVALLVWLLVSAPGWTRGGRPSAADAWTGEPHVVGESDTPAEVVSGDGAVSELEAGASAATDDSGGTSARW
jgi:hypothetical protein